MMKTFFPVILFFLSACSGQKQINMSKQVNINPVIAHRGAFKKKGFPENSIAALKEAIRLQCTGSEFDVRIANSLVSSITSVDFEYLQHDSITMARGNLSHG